MSFIQNLEAHSKEGLREYLLKDFRAFARFYFKILTGNKLIEVDYYDVLFEALQMLIDHKENRMIISLSPRGGKSLIVGQMLILYSWCREPSGQNMATGYNGDVLAESAGFIRMVMLNPDFQAIFPDVELDQKKQSVQLMGTTLAGSSHFISLGGRLIGKGAGVIHTDKYAGVLVVDDPLKAADIFSEVEREKVNNKLSNTLVSRLARNETPYVVIAQRLGTEDSIGFLLNGGTGDEWSWLSVPAIITKEVGSKEWYDDQIERFGYTHAKPIYYDLKRGDTKTSFWHDRKSLEALERMEKSDPYTFYTQYMQEPYSISKEVINEEDIVYWDELDKRQIKRTFMVGDTAGTAQNYSDYSVFLFVALMANGDLYILDMLRGKWEFPELLQNIKEFWSKHSVFDMNAPTMCPKSLHIEEKSSGLFINQQLAREGGFPLEPIPRDGTSGNDKFSRFLSAVPYFKQHKVLLPRDNKEVLFMKRELIGMHDKGNNAGNDDIVDCLVDSCTLAFGSNPIMDYSKWFD